MNCEFEDKVFQVDPIAFEPLSIEIFRFQARNNPVYRNFLQVLGIEPDAIHTLEQIPFLPIRFFKSHRIATTEFMEEVRFESSGTTGANTSRHYVKDADIYRTSFRQAFRHFYGDVKDWCVIGLLPSYLERSHSSLVMMVDDMIRNSSIPESGFYLYNFEQLAQLLQQLESRGQKTLLIGVTFALIDFADQFPQPLQHTIVMETGGMKGRRRELTRDEVHDILKQAFQLNEVQAEYGMTELLSQAYSKGAGMLQCPPWMRVLLREEDDPFAVRMHTGATGLINVIDLANIYSCSFIATDDIGRLHEDAFEVLGRMDNADVRGCSLLLPSS